MRTHFVIVFGRTDERMISCMLHNIFTRRTTYEHIRHDSCCTSVDEIVCHGIPDSTVLQEGMIVNVDVTVFYQGYHGDCSEMFCVGEVDQAAKDLIQVLMYSIVKR